MNRENHYGQKSESNYGSNRRIAGLLTTKKNFKIDFELIYFNKYWKLLISIKIKAQKWVKQKSCKKSKYSICFYFCKIFKKMQTHKINRI
jgi:hypothetical protein